MALQWAPKVARHYKIGVRLVSVTLIGLVFGLSMVMWTLWLSWSLEGAAAAINDTGSLRMQSVRIGLNMSGQTSNPVLINSQIDTFDETLDNLVRGDPTRPMRLPKSATVQEQFTKVAAIWTGELQPNIQRYLSDTAGREDAFLSYQQALPAFVQQADQLVHLIENENAKDTAFLRGSQMGLIVLMLTGSVALIFLLYGWVIRPVEALRKGIQQMSARDFDTRVPVEGRDEFGVLAQGFNNMAAQLKDLYTDLESRVQMKTMQLAAQNRELTTLYEFSAYLSKPGDLEDRCRGFLSRLIEHFGASGGTVRILDQRNNNLHLTVHQGLSDEFVAEEKCLHVGDCLCGEAAQNGVIQLHDFRKLPPSFNYRCHQEGFNSIAIAQIHFGGELLGSYTLHFLIPREFSSDDRRLFEAVGQHLGVAIENQRLMVKSRELAIAEERNLVAQGLHDSIAQGLNFLKLQVQMLSDSIRRNARDETLEGLALIETGLKESYDDVRELLTNFRIKLGDGDLADALKIAADRFSKQSHVPINLVIQDTGAPLPAEQQLQVLFIVQEALSNIRKHAQASHIEIHLQNERDFSIYVQDDGRGFSHHDQQQRTEQQVGLNIMRERASRLGGQLSVESTPGRGTKISLLLSHTSRIAA